MTDFALSVVAALALAPLPWFVVKLTVLLLAGATFAVAMRRRSAATRHLAWALTLTAALLLVPATAFAPALQLPIPQRTAEPAARLASAPVASAPTGVRVDRAATTHVRSARAREDAATGAAPFSAARVATISWLLGTVLFLGWNILGHLGLARLARRATVVTDGDWRALMADTAARSGVSRPVRLARSGEVGAPITWGVLHPIVLIPAESDDWTPERRRVVLLHELAHIARLDYVTQLVASITCALYWVHPLVWMAAKRLRNESERACDDHVLANGTPAADYAAHLLNVARGARALRLAGAVAIGMAHRSTLEGRMLAVLDDTQVRESVSRRERTLALAVFVIALIPLACVHPVALAQASPPPEAMGFASRDQVNIGYATKRDRSIEVAGAQPDTVIERTVPASPMPGVLRLNLETGGTVSITGWGEPRVRVRARLAGRDWRAEKFSLESSDRGEMIVVRVELEGSRRLRSTSTSNEFEINVPRQFNVRIESGGGALTIADVSGIFTGHTGGGDLVLRGVTGEARLSTGGGDITVTDANLDGTVSTGGGMVQMSRVRGSLRGSSGSGPVIYAASPDGWWNRGSVDAHTGRRVAGALRVEKAGGDISLDDAPDGGVVHTGGGRIHIGRAGGNLEVTTGGGNITVGPTLGSVRAGTGNGNVDITIIGSPESGQDVDVTSGSGHVTITLPPGYNGVVELETAFTRNFGREAHITSAWNLEHDVITDWDDRHGTPRRFVRARATLGNGRGIVRIQTVNGDVELRRGKE